jgi:hypothetical protein
MSLIFEDRRITSPLTGESDETDFTVDNIGDVITVETDFRMETYMIPDSIDENGTGFFIFVDPRPAQTGKVRDDRAIYANDVLAFNDNDWHVGDTWELTGMTIPANNTTGTIIEISEDRKTIITDYNFTVPEVLPLDAYLVNTTTITAVTYKHGLIGNDEFVNYISKVDSSEQIAQLGGLSNTNLSYQTATLLGNKSWQSGSVQIKGNEKGQGNPALISGAIQAFTIKHELIINPLMLADEWQDILNGLKPGILRNEASLRYVFSIDAAPVLKNPNNTTNVLVDEFTGNIGAKDENFNGVPTNYIVSDVVYSRVPSGEIIPSLELTTNEIKVTYTVTNTVDAPFSDGNTKAISKFNYAPANESEYRDSPEAIAETMEHNFMFDDVLSTLGSSSGTPRRFGTDDQVIKEMTTTYVSDSVITVEEIIQMSNEIVTRLAAKTDRRYMKYFSVADHTLLRKDSDKASITVDNNLFFNDVTDPTLLPMANSFMAHTGSVVGTDNVGSLSARVKDDVCCITNLAIDRNGRESDDITISGVTMQIIARKDANTFDVLDEYSTSLNLEIINDIPFVDLTIDRGFATPVDDLRKNIRFKRREDLDGLGFFAYELNFPIIMRWEYWEARDNANEDFFNTSEPNNGWNHDWARIAATSGWDIYYKATVNVVKNGNPLTYTAESKIELEDYLEGTEWDTENIKTYIDSTNDPIFDSPNYGVSLAENTRVEADMTYLGAESYVPADLVSVLIINAKERGNFKELYTLSSLYPPHPNTKWLGISPSDMAVITNPSGDIWRTSGILDYTLLQGEDTWDAAQRMYNPPFTNVKLRSGGGTDKKLRSGLTDKKLRSGN